MYACMYVCISMAGGHRSLLRSVIISYTRDQFSEIKKKKLECKYENISFGDRLNSSFLAIALRVNQLPCNIFLNLISRFQFNWLVFPYTWLKIIHKTCSWIPTKVFEWPIMSMSMDYKKYAEFRKNSV